MSYILDALRRSQAERERGQVPGLEARPAAVAALPDAAAGPPWRWVLLAVMVLGVAALALLWGQRGAAPALPAGAALRTAETAPRPAAVPEPAAAPAQATLPVVVSAPVPPPPAVAAAP
ncbi:MAG: hypothetical protein Q8K45_18875, partial [Rubrivivax sp.]|nr:hypothetical protein [Rubrivivax sp.]